MLASRFKPGLLAGGVVLAFGLAACGGGPESAGDSDGESTMAAETAEHEGDGERAEARSEGEGEHAEGGEGDDRTEGGDAREGGDSREGGEGERGEHDGEGREGEGEHSGEGDGGEHDGEGGHDEGGEEGEEPGIYIDRGDTWDMTRRGARLVLAFNAQRGAFAGRVENTTERRLCAVRVEVHLGGGPELGPTTRTDIPAGGSIEVVLASAGASFETWTAHPELSAC